MGNNRVYTPDGKAAKVCGMSMAAWQAAGNDVNTTVEVWPPTAAAGKEDAVVGWGRAALGL